MTCPRASMGGGGGGENGTPAKTGLILNLALAAPSPTPGMPDFWLLTDITHRGLKHVWTEFTVQLLECGPGKHKALGSSSSTS